MMSYFLIEIQMRENFMMLCDDVFDDEEEFNVMLKNYHKFCQRYKLPLIDHMYGDI